ncbi:unnamed protein product [Tilletia controversa]|uniref:Cytochrome P450 n=3 Tax=Tilletia TaxID=13289 RepID=A0A8X7MX39_9BASI|nr:hypothetical protein CF336_g1714 [Tilletia laevis]KAE8203439.1 hypothetical protein CF328_g1662 [Tilletia controversa]KAE8263583.1 hypothetical protein A4X03_0g1573 [Tilletia caries]KAE8207158.1 hypothetical protein CF335_g1348 [Tilletia laevis]KAE8253055.1 hypothetical protein A4X06_0g1736 [Tilletia controversa]
MSRAADSLSSASASALATHARALLSDPSSLRAYAVPAAQLAGTLAALFIGWFMYQVLFRARYFSRLRHLPGPEYGHWLLGQTRQVVQREPGMAFLEWKGTYGEKGVIRVVTAFGRERIVFYTRSAVKQILVDRPYDYPKPSYLRLILGQVAGEGLLTFEGSEHSSLRKFLSRAFAPRYLQEQYESSYHGPISNLIKTWQKQISETPKPSEGLEIEVFAWVSRCLLDIIGLAAFGYEINSIADDKNDLGSAYHAVTKLQNGVNLVGLIGIMVTPGGAQLLQWAGQRAWTGKAILAVHGLAASLGLGSLFIAVKNLGILLQSTYTIESVAAKLMDQKMDEARKLGPGAMDSGKMDILSLLVKASLTDQSSYKMSRKDVKNTILTVLAAGHETTASGVTWTLWMLAKHPEVQEKLRKEVKALTSAYEHPPFADLKELKYLGAVISESLRVFPPTPATSRQAAVDSVIDGVFIPKGTVILIPSRAMNLDPVGDWGADAGDFKPERWLDLPPTYDATFSLMTFIAGAHKCIAYQMAQNEMRLITAMLVANFHFELISPDQTVVAESAITMKPYAGLPLRVRRVDAA